ncbi:MAG: hypothetical protein ACOYEW_13055 [Anaerolineae bacterium]|jgi:membrane protein implicated in regulation of membrane protease activity
MSQTTMYLIAAGLIVLGLVLLVLGLQGTSWMWQAGLAAVALAMAVAFYTHWVPNNDQEQNP